MNQFQRDLYTNLMTLCQHNEAFYYVDHTAYDILGFEYFYRVFTYRLASYTDFQNPDATECRGHTFLMHDDYSDMILLASMPMQKFWNLNETPYTMNLDLSKIVKIMDKLDGSLISTAINRVHTSSEVILKSKTSFSSGQAQAAMALLCSDDYAELYFFCLKCVRDGLTVNMEFCGPSNRIVLGYPEDALRVLNVRSTIDGSYVPNFHSALSDRFIVQTVPVPNDPASFVNSIYDMTGIEGYIIQLDDGQLVKIKTNAYCLLHKTKDSVTVPRRLFEVCVDGGSDDLRAMFADDIGAINLIDAMEVKVAGIYNHLHKHVHQYYNENKHLSRKDYAIKGQAELKDDGTFSLAMNLYLGMDANIKEFMVKNFRKYGIGENDEIYTVD